MKHGGGDNLLTYISLFSSAGVGCHGFSMEKFDCIATSELIERRLNIQKANHKCRHDSGYIPGDLTKPEIKEKIYREVDYWKKHHKIKNVDVVISTPPCQGMSVANHKKKDELPRNSLVIESVDIIKNIKPKFFIFENVRAFLDSYCLDLDGSTKKIKEAINDNLAGNYNIAFKVLNFKDYGNPTSRTRTVVIGARKDIQDIDPYSLMPEEQQEKTLRNAIGDLPALNEIGEISANDIYHQFRPYSKHMLDWIKDLKEGQSAFDNTDPSKRPHRVIDGNIVYNKNKNGDKYARCYWDKPGPCVHTRNDILASQSTVHPRDNRVFSIRELMRMMSIPDDFKWVETSEQVLNSLSHSEKQAFLKKEETNIRQSLGEAVPTIIFHQIAKKMKTALTTEGLTATETNALIKKKNLYQPSTLLKFISDNLENYSYEDLSKISELANSQRQKHAAFYTRQDICFSIINNLPSYNDKECVSILEPSVGVGNFLPQLIRKYQKNKRVVIDLVDIDSNSLEILKLLIKKIGIPKNFTLNLINDDFLLHKFSNQYDLVIGNPPFGKVIDKSLLEKYQAGVFNRQTKNIFSYFIEKAFSLGKVVALIVPKSMLSAPEFDLTREFLSQKSFIKIADYGEKGFKGVKIETIGFIAENKKVKSDSKLIIESLITNQIAVKQQKYIFDNSYPYWLIYRDDFFDGVVKKIKLGLFHPFRDRQITKKITNDSGKYRVLKSRNIGNNQIFSLSGYDSYVNSLDGLAISKFINETDAILIPNLSYYPRATFKPKGCITDGSVAILLPKDQSLKITEDQLEYFSTEEFKEFYKTARNLGTRSLNIDRNSVFFWGLPFNYDCKF